MHDFIVRERQHEVLTEGVDHAKRQLALMMRAMHGLAANVPQRVVHPTHIPLHREAEPAGINGTRDASPSGRFFRDRHDAGELGMHHRVEVFEERDRVRVLATALIVRNPFAVRTRVVEVQHRRDRIDPQSVNVIVLAPEPSTRQQEVADLEATVVEDVGIPVRMKTATRIGVLVNRRAVEASQCVRVRREVRRHPIDQNADPGLMAPIDELHEVLRSPEATGRGEVARHLIAPRAVKGMLGDRHQLQVRVAQFVAVGDQRVSQLRIRQERATVGRATP